MSSDSPSRASPLPSPVDVAAHLPARAADDPDGVAVVAPGSRPGTWERTSWAALESRCAALAAGLARAGLCRGDRTCLFVRPSADWVALVYALFRLKAVPVLIDPGMGRRNLVRCVERMRPRGFVGIPLAHALRLASPRAFASVEVSVTVGGPKLWSGPSLEALAREAAGDTVETAQAGPDDPAAILFTSGSTGPPKGVLYTHGMFAAQVEALRALYAVRPGDVDLACFPLFALFGAALRETVVLPDMDFARPATCDPARIAAALREHDVTQTFGSPAIWRRVVPWCRQRGLRFEHLERLMIAGAPVEPALVEACRELLPNGDVHTPYGATESLPVASISGAEILARRERHEAGLGNCVGRPVPGAEVRLIELSDEPIETWAGAREVTPGAPGELCVRGPQVTREYAEDPAATRAAKIRDGDTLWHRMGDVARLDDDGCLWFLGRKSHRLETAAGLLMPVGPENVFNRHPRVRRSALVGVGPRGAERPVLVVEPEGQLPARAGREALAREVLSSAAGVEACAGIAEVLFQARLPVDVRHNAKLRREEIKAWAERRLASRG